MDTGIVSSYRSTYAISANSLQDLVNQMRKAMNTLLDEVEITAKKIDLALDMTTKIEEETNKE